MSARVRHSGIAGASDIIDVGETGRDLSQRSMNGRCRGGQQFVGLSVVAGEPVDADTRHFAA
jgi:hypothetical protein